MADFRGALGEEFALHPQESDAEEPSINFEYPRALPTEIYQSGDYVPSVVRLELGARADHEPVRDITIRPYAAEEFEREFEQPTCSVVAQAPERTLLEKALIIHAAIHKGSIKRESSRRAYDLAMMHRDPETMAAVTRDLYEWVAHHKFVFGDAAVVCSAVHVLDRDPDLGRLGDGPATKVLETAPVYCGMHFAGASLASPSWRRSQHL